MRLEIKMPYQINQKYIVEKFLTVVKTLKSQHPTRKINSIYFDNLDMQIARDNINGLSKRCKLRLRYYINKTESNCSLEIKKKINKFGYKNIIKTNTKINKINLNDVFSLNSKWQKDLINDEYTQKYILEDFITPQIKVSYIREYYISENIRITHDKNIEFRPINLDKVNTSRFVKDNINVLEIKFDYEKQTEANNLIDKLPIKPKRFSKYLRGLSYFNSSFYF